MKQFLRSMTIGLLACSACVSEQEAAMQPEISSTTLALCGPSVCYATDFGATPNDDSDDDWEALQLAIDRAISEKKPLELAAGSYKIENTLFVGGTAAAGGPTRYNSVVIRGENTAYLDNDAALILYRGPTDRPAINIQGARDTRLSHLIIEGENTTPATKYASGTFIEPDPAKWNCPGCSLERYTPYAGIAIDGYSGPAPGAGEPTYPIDVTPNDAANGITSYSAHSSSSVKFEDIVVRRFSVGVAVKPSNDNHNAENLLFDGVQIMENVYGLSIGASQQRTVAFENGAIGLAHTLVTTVDFGQGTGQPPHLRNLDLGRALRVFNLRAAVGASAMESLHMESIASLGNFGTGNNATATPFALSDSNIFFMDFPNYRPSFLFESWANVTFDNVVFSVPSVRGFTFLNTNCCQPVSARFDNCWIGHTSSELAWMYRPFTTALGGEYGISADNSVLSFNAANQQINDDSMYGTLPARGYLNPNVWEVRAGDTRNRYAVEDVPVTIAAAIENLDIDSVARTVTFDATDADLFFAGDWLYWKVGIPTQEIHGFSRHMPVLRVSSVSPEGVVTADATTTDLDWTDTPSYVPILRPSFFNKTPAQGTATIGNDLLTGVTGIAGLQEGDWIRGNGIRANTRILERDTETNTVRLTKTAVATGPTTLTNTELIPLIP